MNIQEPKIKQLETAIILRKAEMWQLTCDMQNIKKQIASRQAEEAQLVSQLNQLKLEIAKQQPESPLRASVNSEAIPAKLNESSLKPTLVDKPITPREAGQNN